MESSRASPPHRPREDELAHPADKWAAAPPKRKAAAMQDGGETPPEADEALPPGLHVFLRSILQPASTPPFVDPTRIRQRNVWYAHVTYAPFV